MTAGRKHKGLWSAKNNSKLFKSKEIKFQRSLNVGRAKVPEAGLREHSGARSPQAQDYGKLQGRKVSFGLAKGTATGGRARHKADGQRPSSATSQTFFCTSGIEQCWFGKERRNFGNPGRTTDARQANRIGDSTLCPAPGSSASEQGLLLQLPPGPCRWVEEERCETQPGASLESFACTCSLK